MKKRIISFLLGSVLISQIGAISQVAAVPTPVAPNPIMPVVTWQSNPPIPQGYVRVTVVKYEQLVIRAWHIDVLEEISLAEIMIAAASRLEFNANDAEFATGELEGYGFPDLLPEDGKISDLKKDDGGDLVLGIQPKGLAHTTEFVPLSPILQSDAVNSGLENKQYSFGVLDCEEPFVLEFGEGATVADAKTAVASHLGTTPEYITLMYGGKPLKKTFILQRLRVVGQITVFKKDNKPVFLTTVKSML
ncbi:MAG: ubiquitin family protein [Oscillospiraceae bacterium]|nr:ubiquitin family protein [Oscillospiraceae bacterium]